MKERKKKSLLKHLVGIVVPLAFLLAIGIIYEHLGLIIGSLILGLEGLYVILVVAKRKKDKKGED